MLRIHFLNVGHGDCTVIEHPSGNISLVDINNGSEIDPTTAGELWEALGKVAKGYQFSLRHMEGDPGVLKSEGYDIKLTNPMEFLAARYSGRRVFRYILTHPHLDHLRGIGSLLASEHRPINFWDTQHNFEPDLDTDQDEADWRAYMELRGALRENKRAITVLKLRRGTQGKYFNQDSNGEPGGDAIEILSPTEALECIASETGNPNEVSYVLRVSYKGWRIVLGGDAGTAAWDSIVEAHGDDLRCHVLKASHHGRDTGYHQKAVSLMKPRYTIVSVGKKPETDASNKYRDYSSNVWSTRWKGNITLEIDDSGKAKFITQYGR